MSELAQLNGIDIAYTKRGKGPPVLLLHGFPQTHAMWDEVAPMLTGFTTVAADLRGYGASSKPADMKDMSFRHMAADMVALMQHLGFAQFHLVGHDRGGRTAHRLALDHRDAVQSLTVMDIIPTHTLLTELRCDVAKAYYHWFFLAQTEPFPETMIGHDPDAYYESCLLGWGSAKASDFKALDAYRSAWRDPDAVRCMCNDYRAAIEIDQHHDAEDLETPVTCPALVLHGADGLMDKAYDVPATWADKLSNMRAQAIPGGHFFVDQHPDETAQTLHAFLNSL